MNDVYTVCIDNLRSQLCTVFLWTTWGVSYERCCMDYLRSQLCTVFVWTTWGASYEWCLYGQFNCDSQYRLIDGFLAPRCKYFMHIQDEKSSTISKIYTEMSEEPTTWAFICNCHWKRMVSRVWTQSKTFFATPMRCHFLRNQQKRCSTCKEYNILTLVHGQPFVL